MSFKDFETKVYVSRSGSKKSMKDLLDITVKLKASDLHLRSDAPPAFRVGGELLPYHLAAQKEDEQEHNPFLPVSSEVTRTLLFSLFKGEEEKRLNDLRELDLSVGTDMARFRVNIGFEERGLYATFRVIPSEILELHKLGLPNDIGQKIIQEKQGLVLVTGVTNSGKSTTLASLLQEISRIRRAKIITVEDPIEYAFRDNLSMFAQREVGRDTLSFADAVRSAMRQNPDYVMIGEMRDKETVQQGIVVAQTGNLVFSTLHTKDAKGAVDRMAELFPDEGKVQLLHSLADSLKYVVCQELVPYEKGSKERVLAAEVMVVTDPIRNLIREGKTEQLRNYIQNNFRAGAITMEAHLGKLYEEGRVSRAACMFYARDKRDMDGILAKAKRRE
jgi:twitching motility protein PilT